MIMKGRKLCKIMGAFIVGSGMHSYEEVNFSFNAYGLVEKGLFKSCKLLKISNAFSKY